MSNSAYADASDVKIGDPKVFLRKPNPPTALCHFCVRKVKNWPWPKLRHVQMYKISPLQKMIFTNIMACIRFL